MSTAPRKYANAGAWGFCASFPVAPQGRGNGTFLILLCVYIAKSDGRNADTVFFSLPFDLCIHFFSVSDPFSHSHTPTLHLTVSAFVPSEHPRLEGGICIKISEISYTIGSDGRLVIPADDLAEMGLTAGQEVFVAYIADDDIVNRYEEFAISAVSLSELNDAQQIAIPNALLQEAGIDPNCELQIACIEGAIIIAEDKAMNEEELYEVIERLRTINSLAPNQPCIEKGGTFRDSYE